MFAWKYTAVKATVNTSRSVPWCWISLLLQDSPAYLNEAIFRFLGVGSGTVLSSDSLMLSLEEGWPYLLSFSPVRCKPLHTASFSIAKVFLVALMRSGQGFYCINTSQFWIFGCDFLPLLLLLWTGNSEANPAPAEVARVSNLRQTMLLRDKMFRFSPQVRKNLILAKRANIEEIRCKLGNSFALLNRILRTVKALRMKHYEGAQQKMRKHIRVQKWTSSSA